VRRASSPEAASTTSQLSSASASPRASRMRSSSSTNSNRVRIIAQRSAQSSPVPSRARVDVLMALEGRPETHGETATRGHRSRPPSLDGPDDMVLRYTVPVFGLGIGAAICKLIVRWSGPGRATASSQRPRGCEDHNRRPSWPFRRLHGRHTDCDGRRGFARDQSCNREPLPPAGVLRAPRQLTLCLRIRRTAELGHHHAGFPGE
jgi:hypothetical protein